MKKTLLQNSFILNENNKDIKNINKITFYTKNEFKELLYNDDMYEIAHILKHNYENNIDNSEYIKELKSKNLDLSFLKNTLIFMISKGIPQAVLLQKEFNIDTSNISIETFIEGFINGINRLENSDGIQNFINLYKNKDLLLLELAKKGNILLIFELINYLGFEFNKISDKSIVNEILNNFEINFNKYELFEKINIQGNYDWYQLCGDLFEDFEYFYQRLQNIFDLSDEEKENFTKLKQNSYFESYKSNIHKKIELFNNINYEKKLEYTFNNSNGFNNDLGFENKLKEILVGLNIKDKYSVIILDISGKKEQFNLGNGIELDMYNYGLLEKNIFLEHLIECYGEFKLNLNKNNMDFTILIFKQNGDKDDIPDEEDESLAA